MSVEFDTNSVIIEGTPGEVNISYAGDEKWAKDEAEFIEQNGGVDALLAYAVNHPEMWSSESDHAAAQAHYENAHPESGTC